MQASGDASGAVVFLLGGPMRVGKTQCARLVNQRAGISLLSMDDLVHMLELARPELGIGHGLAGLTWRDARGRVAPFVEALARVRLRGRMPILIEGELEPEAVARIVQAHGDAVRACFAGRTGIALDDKVRLLRAWSEEHGDWLSGASEETFVWAARESLEASLEYREAAARLGIPYFEMGPDFHSACERVASYLLGHTPQA